MATSPVIILGSSRSGTTMLTRLLETAGLFVGDAKESNTESKFFLSLNQWMLSETNASWDNPYCFNFMTPFLLEKLVAVASAALKGPSRENYLGTDKVNQYSDIAAIDFPWGWKDPRNTYTIDVWEKLFPDARVIHIYRNPVDVADSLRRREIQRKEKIEKIIQEGGINEPMRRGLKIQTSVRAENLREGIALWTEYIEKSFALSDRYGDAICHVRYEDFLESPATVMERLTDFVGLNPVPGVVEQALTNVDATRMFAFLANPELVALYKEYAQTPLMKKLGYADLA